MDLNQIKILITGGKGMLACDLIVALKNYNTQIIAKDVDELDILNPAQVDSCLKEFKPDILINCAAYTAVDKCETEKIALEINGTALKILGEACKKYHCKLVHFSTDYIFSGNYTIPILEDEKPNPINQYGVGKLLGETNIIESGCDFLILRVQWLYGKNGKNFVDTMIRLSKERKEIKVVDDQIGRPTSTSFLSEITLECIKIDLRGIFHAGPMESCSWHEFASYILKDTDCKVIPIPSTEYPMPAKRPLYSVLSIDKLKSKLGNKIEKISWKDLVDSYLNRNTQISI